MATGQLATWQNMQSKLQAMGYAVNALIGEPRSGIQSGLVAIIPSSGEIDQWVLNAPREVHRVMLRMYQAIEREPQDDIEVLLEQFRADIIEDIVGDFDLGGTIAFPYEGDHPSWEYENINAQNADWRTISVTFAYRVDVAYTAAA